MAEFDCDEAIVLKQSSTDSPAGSSSVATASELSHAEVRARLSDYFDGSLSGSEAPQVERHLATCADCSAFSRTLYQTIQGLRSLGQRVAPPDAKRRLRQLTVEATTSRPR